MPHPTSTARLAAIAADLDRSRAAGALRTIVVPPCPELLARLQAVMQQPEAERDLQEVARIAQADVAMSATLIRAASSARVAAGAGPAASLGMALNRLGLRETARVMTAFLVRNALPVRHRLLQDFWERSSARARNAAFVAGQLAGASADLAYTYGLFCHVGIPVMMQSLKGYAGTMIEAQARRDRSVVSTENASHRTDHAVVGALTARVWRLAPEVMGAIRLHHDLDALGAADIPPPVQTLVAIGLVAERMTLRDAGLDAGEEWAAHGAAALGWLDATEDDLHHWDALAADEAQHEPACA